MIGRGFAPIMFGGPFFGGHHCGGSTRGFWPAFGITAGITAGLGLFSALFGHKSSTTYSGYYPGTSMMGYSGMSMMGWPGMSMGYPGLNLSKNAEDPLSGLKDGNGDVITASSQQELMSKLGTPKTTVSDKAKAQTEEAAEVKKQSAAQQGTAGTVTDADDDTVPPSSSRSTGSNSARTDGSSSQVRMASPTGLTNKDTSADLLKKPGDLEDVSYESGRRVITRADRSVHYYAADGTEITEKYFKSKAFEIGSKKEYSSGGFSIRTQDGKTHYYNKHKEEMTTKTQNYNQSQINVCNAYKACGYRDVKVTHPSKMSAGCYNVSYTDESGKHQSYSGPVSYLIGRLQN